MLSQKLKSIIKYSGLSKKLIIEGVEYYGIVESNTYTQKYRDIGYVDNIIKTFIGCASDWGTDEDAVYPSANQEATLDDVVYRVAGYQLDPMINTIRVDLIPLNDGDA